MRKEEIERFEKGERIVREADTTMLFIEIARECFDRWRTVHSSRSTEKLSADCGCAGDIKK